MKEPKLFFSPEVDLILRNYPREVSNKLEYLRKLIQNVVEEEQTIDQVQEKLKWGEPSYVSKYGSTLRMDWKPKFPRQIALYFQCTSQLVPTFKSVFGNLFNYQGNRAILFNLEEDIPDFEVKQCIKTALIYHRVKKMPYLGMGNRKVK